MSNLKKVSAKLGFECLEDRLLLAGNITGVFANGTLTLVEDNKDHALVITQDAEGVILTDKGASISIPGLVTGKGSKATINDEFLPFINKVNIVEGTGKDSITATNLNLSGTDVAIAGGKGADTITLTNVTANSLAVSGNGGADALTANFSHFTGSVSVDGFQKVNMKGDIVDGDLSVSDSGKGADVVDLNQVAVHGNLAISTGSGNDKVTLNLITVDHNTHVSTGDGNDTFKSTGSLYGVSDHAGTVSSFDFGAGNDDVTSFDNSFEHGNVFASGGDGKNTLHTHGDVYHNGATSDVSGFDKTTK